MAHLHQALEKSKHLESAAVNTGDVTVQTGEIPQTGVQGQECPLSCSAEHGGCSLPGVQCMLELFFHNLHFRSFRIWETSWGQFVRKN